MFLETPRRRAVSLTLLLVSAYTARMRARWISCSEPDTAGDGAGDVVDAVRAVSAARTVSSMTPSAASVKRASMLRNSRMLPGHGRAARRAMVPGVIRHVGSMA